MVPTRFYEYDSSGVKNVYELLATRKRQAARGIAMAEMTLRCLHGSGRTTSLIRLALGVRWVPHVGIIIFDVSTASYDQNRREYINIIRAVSLVRKSRRILGEVDCPTIKLTPLGRDACQPQAWAIFFDDNIGRLGGRVGAHIVDIRDAKTGERVLFETARKRHAVRAEPYLALTRGSANYFLDEIWKKLSQRGLQTSSSVPVP